MDPAALTLYQEKAREFTTPLRLYCYNKSCSKFLGARRDTAFLFFCRSCSKSTCARCTNAGHPPFTDCPDDAAAQEVLELGREQGWQRCPGCKTLVELNLGCNHMTCRCRKEFCYVCAATWKTCLCPQWDEVRLFAAAEERVERMPEPVLPRWGQRVEARLRPVADHAARVRRVAEDLRENHDCQHRRFAYRPGGGRCEYCQDYLPTFLFVSY